MLKVLIMGPAGSGKGTVSEKLIDDYKIAHISTGDMFRTEIKNKTALGLKAAEYISQGLLVPDDVTIAMVKNRIQQDDCVNGYLLDGFPRSLKQAEAIEELGINCVLNLSIDNEKLITRIENRRVCRNCQATYNLIDKPSKVEGVCDYCGGELEQRADDTREKLSVRLNSYENETVPVVQYYREKGIVYDIDADRDRQIVYNDVVKCLDKVAKELN